MPEKPVWMRPTAVFRRPCYGARRRDTQQGQSPDNRLCVTTGRSRTSGRIILTRLHSVPAAMPLHTHYDNLKVARSAPPEVIRAAYRVLAQKYHPDVNKSPDAGRIMKVINEAYAVLSDPERRAAHDAWIDDQLITEAIDEAKRQTGQAERTGQTQNSRQAPQEGPTPASAATQVQPKASSNHLAALAVVGLLFLIGLGLKGGIRQSPSPSVVQAASPAPPPSPPPRTWTSIGNSAEFARLSDSERDSVREAYFERVIALNLASSDLVAAKQKFYRESGHTSTALAQGGTTAVPNGDSTTKSRKQPPPVVESGTAWSPNGKPWPLRAAYLDGYPRLAASGLTRITIDNTQGGADVYVKLCRSSANKCDGLRHVFIPLGASFTISNITPGSYDIRYRSLDNGKLAKSEPMQLQQIENANGTRYSTVSLTLYRVEGGNTQFENLSEDKF